MFEGDAHEILDVVNENDQVIDTIKRGNIMSLRDNPGHYIRFIDVFIQRSNGDIYLPRRSKEKKIAPGGLDVSVAGHVLSGESYSEACIREIKEESGIDTTMDQLDFVAKIGPTAVHFYFREVYLLHSDQTPVLSPEHTEALWVKPEDMAEVVQNDVPTKDVLYDDIPLLIQHLKQV